MEIMYVFIVLGIILFIIGMTSNKEIHIEIAKKKQQPISFEPKNKTENHKNIILVGIILSAVIATTSLIIIKMSNAIIDNQGKNKSEQAKYEIKEQKSIENYNLPSKAENINQGYPKNGDVINGYFQTEERNQDFLKIGKKLFVLNIDESGDLRSYAEEITAGCNNDEWCEKSRFFEFIKKIPYQTDAEGEWKYNMKPMEVLNYNKGDCDERSFTLTSLLLQKKYKVVIVYAKKHAFVCMHIENKRNIYPHHAKLRINGLDYYYAETTDVNGYIGSYNKVNPRDFIGVYDANKKRLIPKKEIEFYQG
jgi:hypothetical protein